MCKKYIGKIANTAAIASKEVINAIKIARVPIANGNIIIPKALLALQEKYRHPPQAAKPPYKAAPIIPIHRPRGINTKPKINSNIKIKKRLGVLGAKVHITGNM